MSSPLLQEIAASLPTFARLVDETIHVPPSHPQYEVYRQDAFYRFELARQVVELVGRYRPVEGARVLDIGMGVGALATRFLQAGADVVGTDVSPGFLSLARAVFRDTGVRPRIVMADGSRSAFRPGSFDIVLASDVIEHVPDVDGLLRGIAEVMRDEGLVFLRAGYRFDPALIRSDPHYGLPLVILLPRWLRELVVVHLTRRNPTLEDFYWVKNFEELSRRFRRQGIGIVEEGLGVIGRFVKASAVQVGGQGDGVHVVERVLQPARGWNQREEAEGRPFRWSRSRSMLYLKLPGGGPGRLLLDLLSPRPLLGRPAVVTLRLEGRVARRIRVDWEGWRTVAVDLRRRVSGVVALRFDVRPTFSPARLGVSADDRLLGVGVGRVAWESP